jgi:hypothetical protein
VRISINKNIVLIECVSMDHTYIHNPLDLSPKGKQKHHRYSSAIPKFYKNNLAMKNTTEETGDRPIIVWSQFVSVVSTANPLVAFYDIHGRKGEVLLFCSIPDTTRDIKLINLRQIMMLYDNDWSSIRMLTSHGCSIIIIITYICLYVYPFSSIHKHKVVKILNLC